MQENENEHLYGQFGMLNAHWCVCVSDKRRKTEVKKMQVKDRWRESRTDLRVMIKTEQRKKNSAGEKEEKLQRNSFCCSSSRLCLNEAGENPCVHTHTHIHMHVH